MNTIKHTVLGMLLAFIVMSCQEDSVAPEAPVGEGTLQFKAGYQEREVYKLSNARTSQNSKSQTEPVRKLAIYDSENQWVKDIDVTAVIKGEKDTEEIALPTGLYRGVVSLMDADNNTQTAWVADQNFVIDKDKTSQVVFNMRARFVEIRLDIQRMKGAKVWAGPKDFNVSEDYFIGEADGADFQAKRIYYPSGENGEEIYDIVIEYQGKQKRYEQEVRPHMWLEITIIPNEDEQPITEAGQASISFVFPSGDDHWRTIKF